MPTDPTFATPGKTPAELPKDALPPPTAEQTKLNLLLTQTTTSTSSPTIHSVGNFSFTVPTKAKTPVVVTGALFKKEHRPAEGSDEERRLILAICADIKSTYELLTTSKNNPNMLKTIYSLSKLITNTKNHFIKFDLADPFLLVHPMAGPNGHVLKLKSASDPTPITTNLWTQYHSISPKVVAASCTYYHLYSDTKTNVDTTLRWSYRYFEKNVETNLFNRINNSFLDYPPTAQGGPLFFKLLVDALSVSNDAQLLALQAVVYKYNIKDDCEAEDINDAVAMLKGITESIYSTKENVLPEQYVRKLLLVFQTTSVPPFNDEFKRLEQDLDRIETIREADPNRLLAMQALGGTIMTNDLETAQYIFHYAIITHRKLQASGVWDEHVRKPPGTSSFIAASSKGGVSFKQSCFNCGKPGHRISDCPLPINQSTIDANKAKYIKNKNATLSASNSKWRPPIASEGGKRIVGGNPFTWSPPGNRWIRDTTPSTGITPIVPPTGLKAAAVPPLIETAEEQPSDDITTASTVAQMQVQIAGLQRKLASVQDSLG